MLKARRGYFSIAVAAIAVVCALSFDLALLIDGDNAVVVKKIPTTHKVIALTIDDGPHQKTTPAILKILKEKKVKATFFVLGMNAEKNSQIIARQVAEGHEIASHGYSHKQFSKLSAAQMREEIDKTEKVLAPVAPKPEFFRPPYGSYNDKMVSFLRQRGYTTALWSIDSNDWRLLSVEQVVKNVVGAAAPGKIILVHDGQHPLPTTTALPIIIDRLHAEGYEFVTMSELLNYYEVRR